MTSDKMQAIAIRDPGPDGRLEPVTLPRPRPGPGEVLIAVAAAGVNHADLFQVRGNYPLPPGDVAVPGLEVSGRVAALGAGVTGFAEGDAVCALLRHGGYADYVTVPARQALPLPPGIAVADAAALPEVVATVLLAWRLATLTAGETVVIHGGASGIGTAAIQLARLRGAGAIATVRDPAKRAWCEALGAIVIEASPEGFARRVQEASGGKGADVILDMLGGAYAPEHLEALRQGGRIVTLALLAGKEATLPLGRLLLKNLSWHGMTLGSRSDEERASLLEEMRDQVWPAIEQGEYRVLIDRAYPLHEASEAQARMRRGEHRGKIVLTTG